MLLAHQAVDEHHEPRRRLREGLRQRAPPRRDRQAADADGHRLLQRAVVALQAVADQPVEEREADAAGERRRQRALGARAALDQRLRAAAGGARRPAERADDTAAIASCTNLIGVPSGTKPNARAAMSRSIVPMLSVKPRSSSKPRRTSAPASSSVFGPDSVMDRCTVGSGRGYG